MAKRILVYTNHFYPEQFKVNEIVEWLSNKNSHIRVITGLPNYPLGKIIRGYSKIFKDNVVIDKKVNGPFYVFDDSKNELNVTGNIVSQKDLTIHGNSLINKNLIVNENVNIYGNLI